MSELSSLGGVVVLLVLPWLVLLVLPWLVLPPVAPPSPLLGALKPSLGVGVILDCFFVVGNVQVATETLTS